MSVETGTSAPQSVTEQKVARAVNELGEDLNDQDRGPEAAVSVDSEVMAQAEAAPEDPKLQAEHEQDKKVERQKVSVSGSLEDLYRLLGTDQFSKEEIAASLSKMVDRYGQDNEKWMELTSFLETADSLFIENFPADKKIEIICALAEVVVEGNGIDGETVGMLSGTIEYYPDPSAMNKDVNLLEDGDVAAGWTVDAEGNRHLVVFDKLFTCGKPEQRHIIKHELSHSLDKYGEIYSKEQKKQIRAHFEGKEVELDGVMKNVVEIIETAKENKAGQSERIYKFLLAIEKLETNGEQDPTYIKAKAAAGEEGLTFESYLAMVKADAAEEIMAEQSAAYLESDGSYVDFVRTSLENRSPELYKFLGVETADDKKTLDAAIGELRAAETTEAKDAVLGEMKANWPKIYDYMREKNVFYKNIDDKVKKPDFKEAVAEKIRTGTAEDQEEFYDGGYGEDYGNGEREEGSNGGDREKGESLLDIAKELAKAADKELTGAA